MTGHGSTGEDTFSAQDGLEERVRAVFTQKLCQSGAGAAHRGRRRGEEGCSLCYGVPQGSHTATHGCVVATSSGATATASRFVATLEVLWRRTLQLRKRVRIPLKKRACA